MHICRSEPSEVGSDVYKPAASNDFDLSHLAINGVAATGNPVSHALAHFFPINLITLIEKAQKNQVYGQLLYPQIDT